MEADDHFLYGAQQGLRAFIGPGCGVSKWAGLYLLSVARCDNGIQLESIQSGY
jgi:hypothetical protein